MKKHHRDEPPPQNKHTGVRRMCNAMPASTYTVNGVRMVECMRFGVRTCVHACACVCVLL